MTTRQNKKHITQTFTKQHSQFYCGLACLASIVKYYGGETTQEKLYETSGTTLNGTSLLGLYQSAQKLGFDANGYEAKIEDIKEQSTPVILHIVKEDNMEHFVVCYGFECGSFTIGDPSWGVTQYTAEELEAVWKSKTLLKLVPGKNFITQNTESGSKRRWFFELIKSDYPLLGIAAFLGIIISTLGLATAIFSQKLVDHILPEKNIRALISGLLLFGLILLANSTLTYIRSIFLIRQSKEMNTRLVTSFFGKLLLLPKPFFDSTSTGDMIARMNDASRIQKVVVYLSSQIVIDILIVIVSAAYIFFCSVSTGLMSLLAIPVFGFLAWRYNNKVTIGQREVMEAYALSESKYIDTINGINTIKTFGRENLFSKAINSIYHFFMQKVFDLGVLGASINFWISTCSGLMLTGIISWCAWLVLEEQLLLGQMVAIISLVGGIGASVISIAMANIQLQEARIAFDRMYEFASAKPEFETACDKPDCKPGFVLNELRVEKLNFRFPGKSLLLQDLDFAVKKGEIVALFGEIGCGKSTVLNLLQRFNCFESGRIWVGNKDWKEIATPVWRSQLACVPQHVQLFNGTVLENICLAEDPDPDKLVKFCKEYGFHDFIMNFQQGYCTIINENSTNLSGGQQQLIALARALYNKPQLLLLDEATAAMGKQTEAFVVNLLKQLKTEMAVILVSHRPQLVRNADRIFTMENKTISASGSHVELIENNKFYRKACEELNLINKN